MVMGRFYKPKVRFEATQHTKKLTSFFELPLSSEEERGDADGQNPKQDTKQDN